jgi:hypothetical protein
MRSRQLLVVGAVMGAALALAALSVSWIKRQGSRGRLSEGARKPMGAAASAMLDETLPAEPTARTAARAMPLQRLEATLAGMPPVQQEGIDRRLARLNAAAGRLVPARLDSP